LLNPRLFIWAIITVMKNKGVNTPCDLRNNFSYNSSHMIHQTLSMNFNELRPTSLAWGHWLSEKIFHKLTWSLKKLFVLLREVWIFAFRSLGHAVILHGTGGKYQTITEYRVTYGLTWKNLAYKELLKGLTRRAVGIWRLVLVQLCQL
jgi:hypothetical protein